MGDTLKQNWNWQIATDNSSTGLTTDVWIDMGTTTVKVNDTWVTNTFTWTDPFEVEKLELFSALSKDEAFLVLMAVLDSNSEDFPEHVRDILERVMGNPKLLGKILEKGMG